MLIIKKHEEKEAVEMKKWLTFGLIFITSCILVACGSKTETVTLEADIEGVQSEIIYKAEDDKVIEQSAENVMPYDILGVSTKEEAEETLADIADLYSDIEGIDHNMDFQDDKVIETLTTDYEKVDLKEVSELQGNMLEGDPDEAEDVSLEKSIEMLEKQGYEVVE